MLALTRRLAHFGEAHSGIVSKLSTFLSSLAFGWTGTILMWPCKSTFSTLSLWHLYLVVY